MTHIHDKDFECFLAKRDNYRSLPIFHDLVIDFLQDLSKIILKNNLTRAFPDLITFAFFCRRSNLARMLKSYLHEVDLRFGYGMAIHIAPGNIPINFAFSFVFGLLSGNSNLVRLPSNKYPQNELLLNLINTLLQKKKYHSISRSNQFFYCERSSRKLIDLVTNTNCLIVWGGDNTTNYFKSLDKSLGCKELYFPNKTSSLLIDAKFFISNAREVFFSDFYNDTFLVDQNACSSPTNIYWFGSNKVIKEAQKNFIKEIEIFLRNKEYSLVGSKLIDKYLSAMRAIEMNQMQIRVFQDSSEIWHTSSSSFNSEYFSLGAFNFINLNKISDMNKSIRQNEQTLTYYGFQARELKEILQDKEILFDRIVPVGKALDMDIIWDGIDIISHLSKRISIK